MIQFNANCVHAAAVNKEVADGADVVFTDTVSGTSETIVSLRSHARY